MARNPQPRWRVRRRENLKESIAPGMILRQWRLVAEKTDQGRRLLRARRERPSRGCSADERDEFAPPHARLDERLCNA